MAKDNIALLNDIAASLRKMNQANIRDQLQQREFRDRQEAIVMGQPQAEDQGPAFIDAAEDFRRRIKGSVSGALVAEKFSASGIRARRSNKKADEEEAAFKANIGSVEEEKESASHLSDIYNLLVDWRKDFATGARNAARTAAENANELPPVEPLDPVIGAEAGVGIPSAVLEARKRLAEIDEGNFISRNIKKVVTAVTIGSSMAIDDIIRGYKRDGLDGAIASFLGGNAEGGLANSIRQAFTVGTTGVLAGAAIGAMGGPIGALAGGIIGLAIGAITGFLGADRINAWMDEAGKNITDAWAEMTGNFISLGRDIGRWIYTPGTKTKSGNHPAVNATMFGGLISWNIDEYGSTFTSAFIKVMDNIISLPGKIAAWIKRTVFEKSPALGKFLFGDGLTTEEREAKQAMEALTAAKTTSGSFKSGFNKAEVAFAGAMGKEEVADLWFGDTREDLLYAVRNGDYGLTGMADPGGELKFTHPNLQFDGDEETAAKMAALMAEEDAKSAAKNAAIIKARELRIMNEQTEDRNLMRLNGYSQAPVVVPVNSDSSTTTTNINTTINNEKKPGARAGFGSGNNANAIMGEDGFIYSW